VPGVAARPHRVTRLRQLRNEIAAAIVGDDDLRELRGEIVGLRDHPYTGFRAVDAADDAPDISWRDLRLSDRRFVERHDGSEESERGDEHGESHDRLLSLHVHLRDTGDGRG